MEKLVFPDYAISNKFPNRKEHRCGIYGKNFSYPNTLKSHLTLVQRKVKETKVEKSSKTQRW